MKFGNRRYRTLKSAVLAGASLGVLATVPVIAQETEEAATDDRIVITGSRIARDPNLTQPTPVQSIDEDAIRLSGELNIADIVSDIPALVSSLTAENSLTGANELNLRGLGGERTLTLVNGRRHVAGFRGTQAVDTGTIPRALVERVEVTTGGASAIYGADAVTGVVNFILKDDFEGVDINVRGGISSEGDAESIVFDSLWGKNFADGRGNIVLGVSIEEDSGLTYGDRSWSRDNGIDTVQTNPNGGPGEPPRAIISDPRFWLTSQEGSIAPGFGGRDTIYVDINQNGTADCQESEGGRVGFLAGCWLTNPDGTIRVNQDGQVLNGLWGIGGDGGRLNFNRDSLFPETDRYVINLNGRYDVAPTFSVFFEAKYVNAESTSFAEQDTFYDTLFIQPDNAFLPAELQPVVDVTGGLLLTQDPLDFSDNNPSVFTRETTRFVAGFEWEFAPGHFLEGSANNGVFKQTSNTTGLYLDRVFAALDSVIDPQSGEAVCRSDLDPDAFYEIDYFTAGNGYADGFFSSNRYYSFTPGDGQCAPLNPFGTYSASEAAQNFVTSNLEDQLEVEQTVLSLIATGQFEFDFADIFLDGPIGYAAGGEYREESSQNNLDPLTLGFLPETTSFTPGVLVSEVDPFLNSFTSIDNTQQFNTGGSYDVYDVFAEILLPIFVDRPFAEELTFDAAVRQADYSTLGEATTWKVGGTWTPVSDLTLRATFSEAVRAPNISELFDPQLPTFVDATDDPCDPSNINSGSDVREANCIADLQAAGVPLTDIVDGGGNYIWVNPLTGRFAGTSGGNPDLEVETAETFTIGAVFQPRFLDGFSLTVDYWDIELTQGIAVVEDTDLLNGCVDSESYPAVDFCDDYERRADGGLTDITFGTINFTAIAADGWDVSSRYDFDYGENSFGIALAGSYQESLNRFFNASNPTDVNIDIEEIQTPQVTGNLTLSWARGPLSTNFQTTYQSRQFADDITNFDDLGEAGFFDEVYIFDANASYEFSENLSIYGGVNNIADEEPFSTQTAWPVGPRGRYFFLGVNYRR